MEGYEESVAFHITLTIQDGNALWGFKSFGKALSEADDHVHRKLRARHSEEFLGHHITRPET